MITKAKAYMCTCDVDTIRENRAKKQACRCRDNLIDQNLKLWKQYTNEWDMHKDIGAVWNPWQEELFSKQKEIEAEALKITDQAERSEFLTKYSNDWGVKVVNKAWDLGDFLWTKYDEKF